MKYHPKKGILKPIGERYSPIGNRKLEMYQDSKGFKHSLDGTEIDLTDAEKEIETKKEQEIKSQEEQERELELKDQEENERELAEMEENRSKFKKEKRHREVVETLSEIKEAIHNKEVVKEVEVKGIEDLKKEVAKSGKDVAKQIKAIPKIDLSKVIKAIEKIEIPEPKDFPQFPKFPEIPKPIDYSKQLKEISSKIKEPDLKPLLKALEEKPPFEFEKGRLKVEVDRVAMVGNGGAGVATEAKQDPLSSYKITDIDDAGYYGYLKADGAWYIMSGIAGEYRYIKGDSDYATNWTNRESLTYGYFYEIF